MDRVINVIVYMVMLPRPFVLAHISYPLLACRRSSMAAEFKAFTISPPPTSSFGPDLTEKCILRCHKRSISIRCLCSNISPFVHQILSHNKSSLYNMETLVDITTIGFEATLVVCLVFGLGYIYASKSPGETSSVGDANSNFTPSPILPSSICSNSIAQVQSMLKSVYGVFGMNRNVDETE